MRLIDADGLKNCIIKNENFDAPNITIATSASFTITSSGLYLQPFSIPSPPKLQICQNCGAPLIKTSYGFKCEYCDSIYA